MYMYGRLEFIIKGLILFDLLMKNVTHEKAY